LKNIFTDDMIETLITFTREGKSTSQIVASFNKKFGTHYKRRSITDKLYVMRKSNHGNNDSVNTESQQGLMPVVMDELSDEDIKKLANGEQKEVQTTFDVREDSLVHHVIRKPLTPAQKVSKDTVLTALGFDPNNTELKQFRESFWQSYTKSQGIINLSSIKYSVNMNKGFSYTMDELTNFIQNIKSNTKAFKSIDINCKSQKKGNMLLIPVADLHYGLYSTRSATSGDYNMEIAEERFFKVINESVSNAKKLAGINKIVLVLGNDFFNADTLSGTTVKGTPQDQENGGLKDIYHRGVNMVIKGIEMLAKEAPVTVMSVLSNHDEFSAWAMMVTLDKVYTDKDFGKNKSVEVIYGETPRTYLTYGNSLLGFTHHANLKDVLPIVSTEQSKQWGVAKHKFFFMAHYHHELDVEDKFGLVIHRLPTISGKSKWANGMGYIGSEEKNKSYLFSEDDGMIASFYVHS